MTHPPTTSPPATTGGVSPAQRSLAPDLARGFMLLVIATVHAHMFRVASGAGGPTLDGTLDVATTAFMTLFGENRGYPMFAALFGYGLAQIYLRRTAEGHEWPWVRRLLRRRGRWLVAIGLAHTVLLFYGDVIAVYGLIALLFTAMLRFSDRRLLSHAFAWMAAGTLVYSTVQAGLFSAPQEEAQEATYLIDFIVRLAQLPVFLPLMIMISVFPFMVGVWAARRRVLEEPERHRDLLRRVAIVGISASVIGGIPQTLVTIEVWNAAPVASVIMFWAHMLTGYAGAFGYAAVIGLLALRIGQRRGPVVSALAATGQRSMTCYLLQSVVWAVLFPAYTLDLAATLTDTQAVGLGVAVWLATVVLADTLRRVGFRQGPAEWLLRRMTYGERAPATRT